MQTPENTTKKPNAFRRFTENHPEVWKFIKFSIMGGSSSVIELIVHMVFLNLISTTVGYAIAFVLNRKITFKADANPALSMVLYVLMVIFTIFANGWIGSAMTTFAQAHALTGNLWDLIIKIIGMLIPSIWTYPCNRVIIHRHKKTESPESEAKDA